MMAEESLDPIFSMSPALLKKNLGIVPAKHTQEYPNNIIIKKLPCLGRIHFVRDREGITFLSCIVAYWVYGILSSYYCVLLPHYQDGRFPVGVIYCKYVKIIKFRNISFYTQLKCWLSMLEFFSEWQTGKTLIRLLLQKQNDLDLHCLPRPFW